MYYIPLLFLWSGLVHELMLRYMLCLFNNSSFDAMKVVILQIF